MELALSVRSPMESFFTRLKNPLVLLALLLLQALGLAVQIRRPADPRHPDAPQVRLLRLWALALFTPVERVTSASSHGVRAVWSNYLDLRHVREQNRDLQRQLADLRLQRAELAEDALEGHRLQSLLAFRQQYVASTVAARVIGTSGSDQSRILLLNKGARDGLKPDMPVITPDGIVGKLRDVFPDTAQLLLISDPTSGAGVVLQSTRIRAIIKGTPQGRVIINNLTDDNRIKAGEIVLTSGGDQVFPRGLPVGTVESIAPDPEHQPYTAITLKTAANLNQLEEVLVITGTAPGLAPGTEQELAEAAAAHAADLSAARLPGLHDPAPAGTPATGSEEPGAKPAETAAPPAENSREGTPHPKPVNHPDRFSPGATPPAADLTPGARTSTPEPPPEALQPAKPVTRPTTPKPAAPKPPAAEPDTTPQPGGPPDAL